MKTPNYIVNRNQIYVGLVTSTDKDKIVVYPDGLYDTFLMTDEAIQKFFDNRMHLLERQPQLYYPNSIGVKRSMLFVLDENRLANDLLYDSPNYPVFNISDDELSMNASISIKNCYHLGRVLDYFNYPLKLRFEDIVKIKEAFFRDFILDNCELFGRYETPQDETSYETYDMYGNHRTFNLRKDDSVFPDCYFEAFWKTRSCGTHDKFIPDSEEGVVKALIR